MKRDIEKTIRMANILIGKHTVYDKETEKVLTAKTNAQFFKEEFIKQHERVRGRYADAAALRACEKDYNDYRLAVIFIALTNLVRYKKNAAKYKMALMFTDKSTIDTYIADSLTERLAKTGLLDALLNRGSGAAAAYLSTALFSILAQLGRDADKNGGVKRNENGEVISKMEIVSISSHSDDAFDEAYPVEDMQINLETDYETKLYRKARVQGLHLLNPIQAIAVLAKTSDIAYSQVSEQLLKHSEKAVLRMVLAYANKSVVLYNEALFECAMARASKKKKYTGKSIKELNHTLAVANNTANAKLDAFCAQV